MKPLLLVCFVMFTLACGVTSPEIGNVAHLSDNLPTVTPTESIQMMVVVADEAVYVRVEPSLRAALGEREALFSGEIVIVTEMRTVGDCFWCLHEFGWSNCKFLAYIKETK